MIKVYFIRTYGNEDTPAMTCSYPYRQWKELIKHFKAEGIEFDAWSDYV